MSSNLAILVVSAETLRVLAGLLHALDKGTVVWQADEQDLLLLTDLLGYVEKRLEHKVTLAQDDDDESIPF